MSLCFLCPVYWHTGFTANYCFTQTLLFIMCCLIHTPGIHILQCCTPRIFFVTLPHYLLSCFIPYVVTQSCKTAMLTCRLYRYNWQLNSNRGGTVIQETKQKNTYQYLVSVKRTTNKYNGTKHEHRVCKERNICLTLLSCFQKILIYYDQVIYLP
jgi:hypothetical protein